MDKILKGNLRIYQVGLFVFAFLVLTVLMSQLLPPAIDWSEVFRPAALEFLSGRSPYTIDGYNNPPWTIIFILPVAILPENIGRAIGLLIGLASFTYTAYRLGAKPIGIIFLLLSPPVLHCMLNGSIDWLVAVGFVLPPWIGLFLITIKPQMGVGVVVFWLVEAWRKDRWREVVRIFGPISVFTVLSIIIFGFWPSRFSSHLGEWWNASLWPASIPVGLSLLVTAFRKRRMEYAMGASPCLSPYVLLHSWVGALLAMVTSLPETVGAVVGLWIVVALRV
jgi:hypothetical protein